MKSPGPETKLPLGKRYFVSPFETEDEASDWEGWDGDWDATFFDYPEEDGYESSWQFWGMEEDGKVLNDDSRS